MILKVFLLLLISYRCLAQENSENLEEMVLKNENEIQFLKSENSEKALQIQTLEKKINAFQLDSQLQNDTVQNLVAEVEILQSQINGKGTEVTEKVNRLEKKVRSRALN